ncbi:hypothetical protein [Actinoplanes rectilineatus]|uniref:hypothetical protein n=1 Tax=Actinoplanes rectilineatus TaxID=113571 RepID=UPI0012FC30D6|nr:hypothetical protein [Actinoplanes rectilineatus]
MQPRVELGGQLGAQALRDSRVASTQSPASSRSIGMISGVSSAARAGAAMLMTAVQARAAAARALATRNITGGPPGYR